MKPFIKISVVIILLLTGGAGIFLSRSVTLESLESKTFEGKSVYNSISLSWTNEVDTWDMRQSHQGLKVPIHQWDHIQIKVWKETKPYQVTYHQLLNNEEVELKASCFTCHANGPRVIRPNFDSKNVSNSMSDRISISLMNLRIKLYGRIIIKDANYILKGKPRTVPLRYFGKHDSEKLNVKTCTYCHNNEGHFFSRGLLEKQHTHTIKHLTSLHQMPPWPFKLSEEERHQLEAFVKD